MYNKKILILLYLILTVVTYYILAYDNKKKVEKYLDEKTLQYMESYKVLYGKNKTLSKLIYETKIDIEPVKKIFKNAAFETGEEKNKTRNDLYNYLYATYDILKDYNVKQLHFHLANNESFLRFHRPRKFGDNLTDFRETIKYTNEHKKPIDGFEEGKIYNGYRFVYPMFYENQHIGSVEVSFSTLSMNIDFMRDHNVVSNFLIRKSVVEKKVFNEEKSNYIPSHLEDFYLEKAILKRIEKDKKFKTRRPVSQETKDIMKLRGATKDSFSLYDLIRKEVLTFIKVQNPVNQDVVGIFVVISDARYILNTHTYFYLLFMAMNLFFAIVLFLIHKEGKYHNKLEKEVRQRTKELKKSKKDLQENHDRLETIFSTSKDGIALIDLETNFLDFNEAYLKMTGFTREDLLTKSCAGLSLEEDIPLHLKVIEETIEKGYYENFEKSCIVHGGKKITVNMSLSLMPNKKEILTATKDITHSNKINKKMQDYMQLIDKNIVSSSTDLRGVVTDVSEAYCNLCGYTKEELIGRNHSFLRDERADKKIYKELWNTILVDEVWRGELRNKKKNGNYFWVEISIFPIYDDENKKIGYTSIRHNITDKKYIEELSITDGLTGLYNRRYFDAMILKIINSAKRNNDLICFMMLDIDYFKLYNDTYGHQKGDEALISLARSMKSSLKRAVDYSFRLGGEEFAILFTALNKDDAYSFANKIQKNINALKIAHAKSKVGDTVSVSIGLVCKLAKEVENEETLYKEVDDLLYLAKEQGRNRIVHN